MTSITNYTTLVQAIKDASENDGTEFAAYVPTAISLTEERLFKELELPELEEEGTGTLIPSNNTLTKPTGFKFADYFSLTVGTTKVILKKKFQSFLDDYWPDVSIEGVPKYYSDKNATTFTVAPTPDSNYTYTLRYSKEPTKLSISNATNYFVTNCQDSLFYGCMIEMAKFTKAWSQIPVWENSYLQSVQSWNLQAQRYKRDGQTVPNNTEQTGTNSLKGTLTSQS